jgi:hypothetical protein
MLAVIIIAVSGCSSRRAPLAILHPPAEDLRCPDEPTAPAEDADEQTGLAFDAAVRSAGQSCRDALGRVCRWHRGNGMDVTCAEAAP